MHRNLVQTALSLLYIASAVAPDYPPNPDGIPFGYSYGRSGLPLTNLFSNLSCSEPAQFIIPDSPIDVTYDSDVLSYISKTSLYRFLHLNDSVFMSDVNFSTFYDGNRGGSIGQFMSVEEKLYNGDHGGAAATLAAIDETGFNTVENNYKSYYVLYLHYLDAVADSSNYNTADSLSLNALTQLCPESNGACIYQARALYASIYKVVVNYSDDCEENGAKPSGNFQNPLWAHSASSVKWDVMLFPNPAASQLNFVGKVESEDLQILITDLSGRILLKEHIKTKGFIANLDLALINGAYMVTITSNTNETVTKKFTYCKVN